MSEAPISQELRDLLRRVFPIKTRLVELDVVLAKHEDEYASDHAVILNEEVLRVILRLILWGEDRGERMVNCIKEQEIILSVQRIHEFPERLEAGLQAHAEVLMRLFEQDHALAESCMPADLFYPDVFLLKTARTVEDFVRALSVKSRLGVA